MVFLDLACRLCPLRARCLDYELRVRRLALRCPLSRLDAFLAWTPASKLIFALEGRVYGRVAA